MDRPPARLGGLFVAQFLGAFGDAAFKCLVAAAAMRASGSAASDGVDPGTAEQIVAAQAFVVFCVPFALLALPAGVWADRVSKRSQIVGVKAFEVVLYALATWLLATRPHDTGALFVVLGLLGVHSAFFSPAKYGILPEIVPHERLSRANAQLETWTVVAILTGTVAGPLALAAAGDAPWWTGAGLLLLALIGLAAATFVPRVPAARPGASAGATVRDGWGAIRASRVLRLSILGLAFFWFLASALGPIVLGNAHEGLGLARGLEGVPLAVLGAGFALGALAAGRLSQDRVELGLVPLGGGALALLLCSLGAFDPRLVATCVLLLAAGVASGFVLIPLNSLVQWRAPEDRRGSVLGLTNLLVNTGMLAGALGPLALASRGASAAQMMLGLGLVALLGTAWAVWLLPEAFLRLVLVLAARTIYRLRVTGLENVPKNGGALLAPNHVAMVDGLFLMAVIDRPVRFLVDREQYELWWQKPFMKALNAIPVSASGSPRELLRAMKDAGQHLADGHLVCIFPEGQLTRNGMMQPFRRGVERIAKGRGAPIVPVYLGGVWGSIFSGSRGKFVRKWPERIPYPVSITFGAPLPDTTSAAALRQVVVELGESAWRADVATHAPLHRQFVVTARRHPHRRAVYDANAGDVSRTKLLASAIALARHFRARWSGERAIGILLPPSVASTALNVAASLAGKPSVNLNYTAGRANLASAARQAGLTHALTSRAFLEKAKLELPDDLALVYLEDERPKIGRGARLSAWIAARFASVASIERSCGATRAPALDDVVTILFSSGSTGEPKGVPLTHENLAANTAGVAQVFGGGSADGLLGILPTFHSFGYMAMWFALNHGVFLATHPNPLDPAAVGKLVESKRLTLLIATPTFLSIYARRVPPAQFGSLRVVMAGAEKLTDRVAGAFEERFGLRPIEGYGTTECSPVVAVSAPTVRRAGVHQAGWKKGSVGQALPGVVLRVVDPDTFAPLPTGTAGMLLVKGANVMRGYLDRPDLTEKVLRDGWYVTGDIAVLDEEGFLRITDRLSRFSKIGGEMVPHGKVEDALQHAAGADLQVFAVTALPDEKKGERLAVLTTLAPDALPAILEKVAATGLPNLFLPRLDAFVHVDALPLLGTGKLDLKRVKQIAAERLGPAAN